ncbi:outer membrane lipoprotein carrier protein LolA [Sphingomonas sp. LY29]|uniref:LolA family protein n=1 Tax=unclassified Sphingomonas TaxID=196159 RepID=UPI002ADEE163|nr:MULTISPECIES: outer membrane lipoprotein carrier protein LolA [unclassified Sphingomonas]MEA1072428.1 outer membrane lipoprotein carrier protein LolA [Sphingomonas sp. LY160]WRP24908.1 outer membrane lipoprotein carrier protein LolA [Sphingomonas sp. LY29]
MTFATTLSRALIPVALVATVAAPAAAQSNDLRAVQQSLAATSSMTANFLQADGRGRQMAGTLTLKRPGKIRFAYGGGVNMLLVANGKTLNFIDYDVGQKSSWPIGKSPLAVLLSPTPDLGRIARLQPSDNKNVVVVRARDARRPEFGTIVLAFQRAAGAPGGLRLEGWTAIDAQNKRTTVRLSNQRYNVAVPDSAFNFAEPKRKKA